MFDMTDRREKCKLCDHFIEEMSHGGVTEIPNADGVSVQVTFPNGTSAKLARYNHLDDGEQEYNHDAQPSGEIKTLAEWKVERPELFTKYRDGKIGPNSIHYSRIGKEDSTYVPTEKVDTYRKLKAALEKMSDEQLDSNISVHAGAEDEFFPAELRIIGESDVLDENHPVIYYA